MEQQVEGHKVTSSEYVIVVLGGGIERPNSHIVASDGIDLKAPLQSRIPTHFLASVELWWSDPRHWPDRARP